MNGIITHPAKVTKVTGATVEVKILAESACASCRVRNKCGMGESREKLLVAETLFSKRGKLSKYTPIR